jgi:NADH dehydrogenase/NADH:ubiquinone oxidoreductase subunit G
LVGTNPRFESSMLNLKIRKHYFNKELLVGYIGPVTNLTYPVLHLGNSLTTLITIAEGKHKFCQNLRNAKKPLIIFGSELGFRLDIKVLENLGRFISKKNFLMLKNFCGFNILHQHIAQTHLCNLGLNINAKSFLYSLNYEFQNLNSNKIEFLNKKKDFFFIQNVSDLNSKNIPSIFFFNTHKNTQNVKVNSITQNQYIFPIKTFFEKDSLLINIEGRVQNHNKVLSSLKDVRNAENYFKLFGFLFVKNFLQNS